MTHKVVRREIYHEMPLCKSPGKAVFGHHIGDGGKHFLLLFLIKNIAVVRIGGEMIYYDIRQALHVVHAVYDIGEGYPLTGLCIVGPNLGIEVRMGTVEAFVPVDQDYHHGVIRPYKLHRAFL